MIPPHERPTAQQLASGSTGGGYACPRCGCKDWRGEDNSFVEKTRHPANSSQTVRRKICRHCGQSAFRTIEAVVPEGMKLQVVPEDEEESEAA